MMKSPWQRFALVFTVLALFSLWLQLLTTGSVWDGLTEDRIAPAFFSIVIVSWLLSQSRWHRSITLFKLAVPWLVVLFMLFSGYVFRTEASAIGQRLRAALLPQSGTETQPGSMQFVRSNDGHFHIHAQINGVNVRFLADTGASDVVLDRKTAARVGIPMENLQFIKIYKTANGNVRGAPVPLKNFSVGSLQMHNLKASVNEAPMDQPLLGMSFFNRLRSYNVQDDLLTIHWNPPPPHLK